METIEQLNEIAKRFSAPAPAASLDSSQASELLSRLKRTREEAAARPRIVSNLKFGNREANFRDIKYSDVHDMGLDYTLPHYVTRLTGRYKGPATTTTSGAYRSINVTTPSGKTTLPLHRVIWVLANKKDLPGKYLIDHIDGDPTNNHPSNLRPVTYAQNSRNMRNVKGFRWNSATNKWQVFLCIEGKVYSLGYFDCMLDARATYLRERRAAHIQIDL